MRVRRYRLGEEPPDDLTTETTAAERIEILVQLSARMQEFGHEQPAPYSRATMPTRVVRPA